MELRKALDMPRYSFYPLSGLTPLCFGGVENGSKVDIYAGCNDGYVRKLDTGTNDTSTAVDSHATWCWGYPGRNIQPLGLWLSIMYQTACTVTPYYAMGLQDWQSATDSTSFTALNDEDLTGSTWRQQGNTAHKVFNGFLHNTDRSFALKLRHNTAGETFEMRKSVLNYRLKRGYYG